MTWRSAAIWIPFGMIREPYTADSREAPYSRGVTRKPYYGRLVQNFQVCATPSLREITTPEMVWLLSFSKNDWAACFPHLETFTYHCFYSIVFVARCDALNFHQPGV